MEDESLCKMCKLFEPPLSNPNNSESNNIEWIKCDMCNSWLHFQCCNLDEYLVHHIAKYQCPICIDNYYGYYTVKKIVAPHRYAYDDPEEKDHPLQVGTKAFIESNLVEFGKDIGKFDKLKVFDNGTAFSKFFSTLTKWHVPYLVKNSEGLGMKLPDRKYGFSDFVRIIGGKSQVSTIDVYAQTSHQMSLQSFLRESKQCIRLFNCISMEFSKTPLAEQIDIVPSCVKNISWVERFWPSDPNNNIDLPSLVVNYPRPTVDRFLLMSMKGSFTNFHLDFGGSSVFYHVYLGKKVFYVAEPTEKNLELFKEYELSKKDLWLGDTLKEKGDGVFKVEVCEGETLFLPGGYLHAVYTPEDSIALGGNFLHDFAVEIQLKVHGIEDICHTLPTFRYPDFHIVNWRAAHYFMKKLEETSRRRAPDYLMNGLKAMARVFRRWTETYDQRPHLSFRRLADKIDDLLQQ